MDPILDTRRQYSVGELTAEIGQLLSGAYSGIWVRGEVSGVKLATSGHAYFTLKDHRATIRAACWKGPYRLLKCKPKDGVEVLVRGRIEVYEPRGEYQLIVESIEPVGAGALQAAFEKLKTRLSAEGLFDSARKRSLPRLPRRIGIVTSPGGAVIRDILHVIERRFPGLHIRLFPTLVQGPAAAEQVVAGLDYFSQNPWADVVILARGGGSLEDLWTFNEEEVARAISRCAVPVVSAIGHETDFTIADFAADRRAPTPSAAAEIVTESRQTIRNQVLAAQSRIAQAIRLRLSRAARRLGEFGTQRAQMTIERRLYQAGRRLDDDAQSLQIALRANLETNTARWVQTDLRLRRFDFRLRLFQARRRLNDTVQSLQIALRANLETSTARWVQTDLRLRRIDLRLRLQTANFRTRQAEAQLDAAIRRRLSQARSKTVLLTARLQALNPLQILKRGFSVVALPDGRVLRRPADAPPGTPLRIRLSEGSLQATSAAPNQTPESGP